ncbi:MAG: ATP-binding protein [Candidatus Altiarchaeota archaeon]|nr:ATP-binding protein [Candidatus Altiarchaeota archaeon]
MSLSKIVFTGGPASGKTTLLNETKKFFKKQAKIACFIDEVPRDLLKEAKITKTRAVPWDCYHTFELKTMRVQIQRENKCKGLTFLDRSAIDVIAYYKLLGGLPPKFLVDIARKRKYDQVFFLDLLPFTIDAERYETSQEEAEKISKVIAKTYEMFGYELLRVPVLPIPKRLDYVLKRAKL